MFRYPYRSRAMCNVQVYSLYPPPPSWYPAELTVNLIDTFLNKNFFGTSDIGDNTETRFFRACCFYIVFFSGRGEGGRPPPGPSRWGTCPLLNLVFDALPYLWLLVVSEDVELGVLSPPSVLLVLVLVSPSRCLNKISWDRLNILKWAVAALLSVFLVVRSPRRDWECVFKNINIYLLIIFLSRKVNT